MPDTTKRIKDLTITTTPSDIDVIAVDNETNGSRGISFLDLAKKIFYRLGFTDMQNGSAGFSGTISANDFIAGQHKLTEKANQTQITTLQSEIAALQSQVTALSSQVFTNDIKTALLNIATYATYGEAHSSTYYQDLYDALYPTENSGE